MKKKLYILLLIVNIVLILMTCGYYIDNLLSRKYGGLGVITNSVLSEKEKIAQYDLFLKKIKRDGRIIFSLLILLLLLMGIIIIQINREVQRVKLQTKRGEDLSKCMKSNEKHSR